MLIDDSHTRELLARIVYRLTADRVLREDLTQEALIHLWLLEERRPGQSRSWYLQSCKFHLQNFISAGKSVDSPKRRRGKVSLSNGDDQIEELVSGRDADGAPFAQVSARDIVTSLSCRLSPFERSILDYLSEGLAAREIATRLEVTHPTVIKYRRKIAALAIRLGIPPLPKYQRNHRQCRPQVPVKRSSAASLGQRT
jgi:DNA-directed RNA polymerase specialized sigma24 family protein